MNIPTRINIVQIEEYLFKYMLFLANTYPLNYSDMTGLPCRVVAEI
jgi:hypothetical protein